MTEKITRAQAEAAVEELIEGPPLMLTSLDRGGSSELRRWAPERLERIRSYLAQQPTQDVVRKAHEPRGGRRLVMNRAAKDDLEDYMNGMRGEDFRAMCDYLEDVEIIPTPPMRSEVERAHEALEAIEYAAQRIDARLLPVAYEKLHAAILAALPPLPEEKEDAP